MSDKKPVTTGMVSRLFIALKNKYGVQWNEQWDGEDAHRLGLNEWYEALKTFSYDEVRKGFDNWTRSQNQPPSISQFVSACNGKKPRSLRPKYEIFESPDFGERASDKTHATSIDSIKSMLS